MSMEEPSGKRVDAPGDRISDLPLPIRLHILSFLTTKSAVKTGVLSKEWARLWTSCPVLRFHQREFATAGTTFVSFVDRVLALRSGPIVRFELRWYRGYDVPKATTWLYYAMSHGVRELVLVMLPPSPGQRIELPDRIFCCPSLEFLDILNLKPRYTLHITPFPSAVSLNNVRHLSSNISASTHFVGELITNCPVLEYLRIAVRGHGVVRAAAPNLRTLDMYCNMTDKDSKIQILSPRLQRLICFFPSMIPAIDLGDLQSLAYASICSCTVQDDNGTKLIPLLTALHNAKTLILSREVIQSVSVVPDLSKHMSLPFCYLKYLEIDVLLNGDTIPIIIILLKSLTNLEKLVIHNDKKGMLRSNVGELGDGCLREKFDCDYSLCQLKEIEIDGFLGRTDELELVNVLLKRASTLRKMILYYKKESWNQKSQASSGAEIILSTMASSGAEIILSTMD